MFKLKSKKSSLLTQLAVLVIGLTSLSARASEGNQTGLFLEPGVSYELGTNKVNLSQWSSGLLNDSSASANGAGVLLRFGIHVNDTLFIGIDGRYGSLNYNDSTNNQSSTATMYTVAPVIGVQMPIVGLRFWGEYVGASQIDPGPAGGYDFRYTNGTGYLLGAGFHITVVSVNLEYKDVKYGSTDIQATPVGYTANGTTLSAEDKAWILSLTFPLEF